MNWPGPCSTTAWRAPKPSRWVTPTRPPSTTNMPIPDWAATNSVSPAAKRATAPKRRGRAISSAPGTGNLCSRRVPGTGSGFASASGSSPVSGTSSGAASRIGPVIAISSGGP